ncbi:unnamed protein product [Caenorhabditis sp. 36 PRJEB53466]|nr:unnamed protein product [Caenorhabditis sp. 36 PRJEB53466]
METLRNLHVNLVISQKKNSYPKSDLSGVLLEGENSNSVLFPKQLTATGLRALFDSHQLTKMAHVESFYLDSNLEHDAVAPPITELELMEAAFIVDKPLNDDVISRVVASQLTFEKESQVVSQYCVASEPELRNPNLLEMSSSILDNNKYFAPPPRVDLSQYAWHTDIASSHHQYAQSPNIYTNDYMTSEPSDYVYM